MPCIAEHLTRAAIAKAEAEHRAAIEHAKKARANASAHPINVHSKANAEFADREVDRLARLAQAARDKLKQPDFGQVVTEC